MKKVSVFRLPIIWLYLGPPAIRELEDRTALSSLEGDQDIWNIIRVAFWGVWGLYTVVELMRNGPAFRDMFRRIGTLPIVVLVWVLSLILSSAISPAPSYTFASASMFLILTLASLDLGVKIYSGQTTTRDVLKFVVGASVLLLTVIWILYTYLPHLNTFFMTLQGPRVRGGDVGYTPIMALVVLFAGGYLAYSSEWKYKLILWIIPLYGFYWIGLGQTRSSYVAMLMGVFILFWFVWGRKMNATSLALTVVTVLMLFGSIGIMYGMSNAVTRRVDNFYDRYVLRDEYAVEDAQSASSSLMTLNGRTEAQGILLARIVGEPFGLGYKAGARDFMSGVPELAGSAFVGPHNSYLDVWAGSGYIGIISWLIIVGIIFVASRRHNTLEFCIVRVLLYSLLLEGMLETDLCSPFKQSSALFWILAACIIAVEARRDRSFEQARLANRVNAAAI